MPEEDRSQVEAALRGKTLQVYWHFVKRGSKPVGVRKIQRTLGFSSPSVASHHLEKLRELGLLKKNPTGDYTLAGEVKVGFLKLFVKLGKFVLPRYLFYASLVTSMLVGYIIAYRQTFEAHNVMALLFGSIAAIILWYEAIRVAKEAPF